MDEWAHVKRVSLNFIFAGKPTDNGICESFNERLRNKCLNAHEFKNIEEAIQIIEALRYDCNEQCSIAR